MAYGHIARERASNKVDIAYLYYLPFAHIIVSNDKLHKRTAPLFLEPDQQFILGSDIKPELHVLNAYYETLPDSVKQEGVIRFASYPPQQILTKIHGLWDQYLPVWRKHDNEKKEKSPSAPGANKALLEHLKSMEHAPRFMGNIPISSDEAKHVLISRSVRSRKGQWRTVPKEVEDKAKEDDKTGEKVL